MRIVESLDPSKVTTRDDLGEPIPRYMGMVAMTPFYIRSFVPERQEFVNKFVIHRPGIIIEIYYTSEDELRSSLEKVYEILRSPLSTRFGESAEFRKLNEALPEKKIVVRDGGRTIKCRWVCPEGYILDLEPGQKASQEGRRCPHPRPRCRRRTLSEYLAKRPSYKQAVRKRRRKKHRANIKRKRSNRKRNILIH